MLLLPAPLLYIGTLAITSTCGAVAHLIALDRRSTVLLSYKLLRSIKMETKLC